MGIYDTTIIGGGIVGISTAWQIKQRYPHRRILLMEKEPAFTPHQSGHNSGVIHAGVYYLPGSLKAQLCREGNKRTFAFCKEHGIAHERCGKLLVATNEREFAWMGDLFKRVQQNRIHVIRLNQKQLNEMEPNISGMGALFVRDTGIVDFKQVARRMAELFQAGGGECLLNTELKSIDEKNDIVRLRTSHGDMQTRYLIACAGLMSDRIVRMLGIQPDYQIIPFRGEYYQLPFSKRRIIQHLIYPIPDPELPFLGIHLTRMIDGNITVGPNAVLGLKREGYRKGDIDFYDIGEMITYKGFWNVMRRNLKSGLTEFKNSWIKRAYLKEVRKYYPGIELNDLQPYPAGVRAQAVDKDGVLLHDFVFVKTRRTFHICNAPSPAATSAIPIGEYIVDRIDTEL